MEAGSAFLALSKFLPLLVFPLCLACAALAAATLLPLRPHRRRMLVGAVLVLLLATSCAPLSQALGRSLEWQNLPQASYPQADAIVLLGGASRSVEFPRLRPELGESSDRIFEAARLFKEGRAPRIHVAAGRLDWDGTAGPEAPELAIFLEAFGVPADALLLESESRNTYENAVAARRMLEPLGVKRILLVTSAMHMPRALGLFRHQGFEVIPAPADFRTTAAGPDAGLLADGWGYRLLQAIPQAESLAYSTAVLREWLGIGVYRLRGLMD